VLRSDCCTEFVERCRDAQSAVAGFDAEFVLAASQVLDERVTSDGTVALSDRA